MATITAITATTTTATNSSTNPSYSVRLGRSSDIDALAPIYLASFEHDTLLDFLFPLRRSHPADMAVGLHRLFQLRYWSAEYVLTVLDDGQGRAVGFAWWKKPVVRQPVWKKWCSPCKSPFYLIPIPILSIHFLPQSKDTSCPPKLINSTLLFSHTHFPCLSSIPLRLNH